MERRPLIIGAALAGVAGARAQGQARLVLGQSLPMSGAGFPAANRVLAGARVMVDRINGGGGVGRRLVELVTLDDAGDPQRTADNVRMLAQQHGALAVLNGLGERACIAAALAARAAGLPLVGPMSGAAALRQPSTPGVFTLQPDDAHESQALLRQLGAMNIARVVHLADGHEPERERVLAETLRSGGVAVQRLALGATMAVASALQQAAPAQAQAVLLSLGPVTLDELGRLPPAALEGLPPLGLTLSGPGLTQLTRLLRGRLLGFTSVMPNPEAAQLPLVREFERDVDAFGSPEAISFEGLAAYVAVQVCAQAMRRMPQQRVEGAALAAGIESLGTLNLGGFVLRFAPSRHYGSEFVEVGLRSRDGRTRR